MNTFVLRLLKLEQFTCNDPTHCHRSPVQKMAKLELNGHEVDVTQDGDSFNVRVDRRSLGLGLRWNQVYEFVRWRCNDAY